MEQKEVVVIFTKDTDWLEVTKQFRNRNNKYERLLMQQGSFIQVSVLKEIDDFHPSSVDRLINQGFFKKIEGEPPNEATILQVEDFLPKKQTEQSLELKSLRTLLNEGIPKIEWRVQGILPKQGIGIFGGTAGSMKSWAGMQLAIACATGTPFLEQFETQKCNVLYVDEENGNITIPYRFDKLVEGHNLAKEPLDNLYISIFNNITLDHFEGKEKLNLLIDKYKPELVILDSMVRCIDGDENKAEDVKQVFQTIKEHLEQGISFILLHHTVKNVTKSMAGLRGSGDFSAFADSVLMFSKGQEGFCNVNTVKNRHIAVEELGEFFFQLDCKADNSVSLEWKGQQDDKGDIVERCVEAISEWISNEQIKVFETQKVTKLTQDLGYSNNTKFMALKLMVERKLLDKLKRGSYNVIGGFMVSREVVEG